MALRFSRSVLKAARKAEGWSLAEAGRRVDVSAKVIQGWEEGRSEPTLTQAVRLAEALGRSLDYFMA